MSQASSGGVETDAVLAGPRVWPGVVVGALVGAAIIVVAGGVLSAIVDPILITGGSDPPYPQGAAAMLALILFPIGPLCGLLVSYSRWRARQGVDNPSRARRREIWISIRRGVPIELEASERPFAEIEARGWIALEPLVSILGVLGVALVALDAAPALVGTRWGIASLDIALTAFGAGALIVAAAFCSLVTWLGVGRRRAARRFLAAIEAR